MLASSDEIPTRLVARLNDALRRPDMWGGQLAIRLTPDRLFSAERRQEAWSDEQRALEQCKAWTTTGVKGAFEDFLPTDHDTSLASVCAEFAHRQGRLTPDRVLNRDE